MFEIQTNVHNYEVESVKGSHGIPWLKPSSNMQTRMAECLPKMVKYKRRIRSENDMSLFVQKHTTEINEALARIFRKSKDKACVPCYWWNDEVSFLHKQLKLAKRRMHRYKHLDLVQEYNLCRQRFRKKIKEVKITSWKVFTSNISDPWCGLMKILSCNDVNKAQDRTLCTAKGE